MIYGIKKMVIFHSDVRFPEGSMSIDKSSTINNVKLQDAMIPKYGLALFHSRMKPKCHMSRCIPSYWFMLHSSETLVSFYPQ